MADRNTLSIEGYDLVIIPRGLDKIWGFRRKIIVPLGSIADISVVQKPRRVRRGIRYPGLDTFMKFSGTFYTRRERHYWNYSGKDPAVCIRLDGSQHFDRLYLAVADAASARDLILRARRSLPGAARGI